MNRRHDARAQHEIRTAEPDRSLAVRKEGDLLSYVNFHVEIGREGPKTLGFCLSDSGLCKPLGSRSRSNSPVFGHGKAGGPAGTSRFSLAKRGPTVNCRSNWWAWAVSSRASRNRTPQHLCTFVCTRSCRRAFGIRCTRHGSRALRVLAESAWPSDGVPCSSRSSRAARQPPPQRLLRIAPATARFSKVSAWVDVGHAVVCAAIGICEQMAGEPVVLRFFALGHPWKR